MSDLNDLIHTNATIAYNQGVKRERERWEAWLARIRTWTLDKSADYQEGALSEQRRIIELLEADMCSDWATQRPYCCDGACSAYNDAMALIKGEQK